MDKLSRLLRYAVEIGSLVPLLVLIGDYFSNNLSYNPIQEALHRTGDVGLILLLLSLACSPLFMLTGYEFIIRIRRSLGLFAFLYGFIHFAIFLIWDQGFVWTYIIRAFLEKPYIILGFGAFIILLALAITSFSRWRRQLGANWSRLHRFVYLAAILVIIHYALVSKGDLLLMRGDVRMPLTYGITLMVLLILRVPLIQRWVSGLRGKKI